MKRKSYTPEEIIQKHEQDYQKRREININWRLNQVFGSSKMLHMDVSIVSVFVVEGYAQGDPPENKASHQDPT